MLAYLRILSLLLCALGLLGFVRRDTTPQIVEVGFVDQDGDGQSAFEIDLTAPAKYEVTQTSRKSIVITFRTDVRWEAPDLRWRAGPGDEGILEGYFAEPLPRKRNMWKVILKFKVPVSLKGHDIDVDINGVPGVPPQHKLSVQVATGHRKSPSVLAQKKRFGGDSGSLNHHLRVVDFQEKRESARLVRYILFTSVPVDFETRMDVSGRRLLLTGPGVLQWELQPWEASPTTLLKSFVIREDYRDGRDAIELEFKKGVQLKSASVVGSSFVFTVQSSTPLSRPDSVRQEAVMPMEMDGYQGDDAEQGLEEFDDFMGAYQEERFSQGGNAQRGSMNRRPDRAMPQDYSQQEIEEEEGVGQVYKMAVSAKQDVTVVDFFLTEPFESSVFQDYNGDIVVPLPYTLWETVDLDGVRDIGLFRTYTVSQTREINQTKVRIMGQKGVQLLEAQNLDQDGKYIVRVVMAQDAAYLTPQWLAQHGTSELPLENLEKGELQTQHLVYGGGVRDTVSIGEKLEIGVDGGYSMGQLVREGATLPYDYYDEGFTRLRLGLPVFGTSEVRLMVEGAYLKTMSGLYRTTGVAFSEPFYTQKDLAIARNSAILAMAKVMVPVGAASVLFVRGGFGASQFLEAQKGRLPRIKDLASSRMYLASMGLNVALTDRLLLGLEVGYERVPGVSVGDDPETSYKLLWEGVLASIGLSFTPNPMAGPSALSHITYVNTGAYVDAGFQYTTANYLVAVGSDPTHARTAWCDRRHMLGWRFGVGYLFFNSPLTLAAELEFAARGVHLARMMEEKFENTTIDVRAGWDIGLLLKPGYMVNHGVRAYFLVGGLQRWYSQVSGPTPPAGTSEQERRELLQDGRGKYCLLGGVFGVGLDVSATRNISLGLSYAYNIFPDHSWVDHNANAWRVGLHEGVARAQIGYNF